MGIVDSLIMTLTYILLFVWVVFPPKLEEMTPPGRMDEGDKKIIADLKNQLESINVEKAYLGQCIINGIRSAKSRETKSSLASILVDLLSPSTEG